MDMPSCDCAVWRIVRKQQANGIVYVQQCQKCGKRLATVKRALAPDGTPDWNEQIAKKWQARWDLYRLSKQTEYQDALEEKNRAWWQKYNTYLLTPEWAGRRGRVLERDQYLCQSCREQRATQVHHLNYKHIGHEPLFDLVGVCQECHEQLKEERNGNT